MCRALCTGAVTRRGTPVWIKKNQNRKQETDTFMFNTRHEESDQSELEPKSDQQLLSHNPHVAEILSLLRRQNYISLILLRLQTIR